MSRRIATASQINLIPPTQTPHGPHNSRKTRATKQSTEEQRITTTGTHRGNEKRLVPDLREHRHGEGLGEPLNAQRTKHDPARQSRPSQTRSKNRRMRAERTGITCKTEPIFAERRSERSGERRGGEDDGEEMRDGPSSRPCHAEDEKSRITAWSSSSAREEEEEETRMAGATEAPAEFI